MVNNKRIMTSNSNTYNGYANLQIRTFRISVKSLANKGLTACLVLISITNLLKSLVFSFPYVYICTNSTHSASRKNSKWVLYSDSPFTKDNTPSGLTSVAHLGGFLFYKPLAI